MDRSTYTDALGVLLCSINKRGIIKKKTTTQKNKNIPATNPKHKTLERSPIFPEILHLMNLKTLFVLGLIRCIKNHF